MIRSFLVSMLAIGCAIVAAVGLFAGLLSTLDVVVAIVLLFSVVSGAILLED